MLKNKEVYNKLLLLKMIISFLVIILIFNPLFGGRLLILNGVFIYFSYFLAAIFVLLLTVLDIYNLNIIFKKNNNYIDICQNNLAFLFTSLILCIGILQGHYVFNPIYILIYIFVTCFYLYILIVNNGSILLMNINKWDYFQRVFFYLFAFFVLCGNQPFEYINIPFTIVCLILLDVVTCIKIYKKYLEIKGEKEQNG